MSVKIGSARSSFGNTARGDQHSGLEVSTQDWYLHSKGWRCFRAKDVKKRAMLAYAMKAACANNKIGYSQPDRLALKNQLERMKPVTYDPSTVNEVTNCDCSSLVRVCCFYAGIRTENFTTPYEAGKLMATGEFTELTDAKYTTKSAYLRAGDILVTKTKGHTVIVLTDGSKATTDDDVEPVYDLGSRELSNGMEGDDVKALQSLLIQMGYSCGAWGMDGDFGDCTEMAVREFQSSTGLKVTGIADKDTIAMIEKVMDAEPSTAGTSVVIGGGNCYVRKGPGTQYDKIGLAYNGKSFLYAGERSEDGWLKIVYNSTEGWVSGKYAAVE